MTETMTVDEVAEAIISAQRELPSAHEGGRYAYSPWDGSGGEWYSAGTRLPADVVGVPAKLLRDDDAEWLADLVAEARYGDDDQ